MCSQDLSTSMTFAANQSTQISLIMERQMRVALPANCLLLETMIFQERQPQTALRGTFDSWSAIKLIYVVKWAFELELPSDEGGEAEKSAAGRDETGDV